MSTVPFDEVRRSRIICLSADLERDKQRNYVRSPYAGYRSSISRKSYGGLDRGRREARGFKHALDRGVGGFCGKAPRSASLGSTPFGNERVSYRELQP